MRLDTKVAIVTGSTSGIGEAAAITLARHGAKVIVTGRDVQRGEDVAAVIRRESGDAAFVAANLSEPEAPERLVEAAVERWGRIDVIVNNAALVCNKPTEQLTHEDWDRLFAVNLKAPFFLVQKALPYLNRTRGTVINVSSINGVRNDFNNLVYDTMKAGLNHMTSGLALDLRKTGIRVNALLPGGVATPLLDHWIQSTYSDPNEARVQAEIVKSQPSVADSQQIADVILFLASGMSSWVNGTAIPLEGGWSLGHASS